MDPKGIDIFLALTAIIFFIKNITEIIIPTKKSKLKIATIIISIIVIIGIVYLYGETWFHYLPRFLAVLLMIVTLPNLTVERVKSSWDPCKQVKPEFFVF